MIGSVLLIQLAFAAVGSACMATSPGTSPAACKNCAMNLITITTTGDGGKPMDGDVIDRNGACATRTFTCRGAVPSIEFNAGDGTIQDDDDGQVDGVTTTTLTCNAAGTAWMIADLAVTQIECASP